MGKGFFIPCFGKKSRKDSFALRIGNGFAGVQIYQNGMKQGFFNGDSKKESAKRMANNNDYSTITKNVTEEPMFTADWEKPEVIRLLLAHLPISSLKTCRLVSKSWNQQASNLLRLNDNFTSTIPICQLREFTQTMCESFDNPIQCYQFHISSMRHPDLRYFFGQLGFSIVSLDLHLPITEAERFFNILPWMPNLMELMLILVDQQTGQQRKEGEKPELIVRLVDPEIIDYIENTKTLIYCNFELKVCQKEVESKEVMTGTTGQCSTVLEQVEE